MRIEEVEKLIGKENIEAFLEWFYGQTLGLNEDGSINYYDWDVKAFIDKLKTGYDRQEDDKAWD